MIEKTNRVTTMSAIPNEFDPTPYHISTEDNTAISDLFRPDNEKLSKFVLKQQKIVADLRFDPYSYFGAIEMPVLSSGSPHPKIQMIFHPKKSKAAQLLYGYQ